MASPFEFDALIACVRDGFMARSPRERLMLTGLGLMLLLTVVWFGVARPMMAWRERSLDRIQMMSTLQAAARASPKDGVWGNPAASPMSRINRRALESGVAPVVENVEGGQVLTFESIAWDRLIPFLADLERDGLTVRTATIERAAAGGQVRARIVVTG